MDELTKGEIEDYLVIEATYPHKLLLCMKKVLSDKEVQLHEETLFLQKFEEQFTECENELVLLKIAYEQNIIDNFLEANDRELWHKKVILKKSLRILVEIVPEYCAVLLIESLMFILNWDITVTIKREWKTTESERSRFHDSFKVGAKNSAEMLGKFSVNESRLIPKRKYFKGENQEFSYKKKKEHQNTSYDSGENIERRKLSLESRKNIDAMKEKSADGISDVLEQKPEQVKYFKQMSFSVRQSLKKALLGDVHSQCKMGDFYADASSRHLDYKEAIRWYEVAAEKGEDRAYFEMGKIYDRGDYQNENGKKEAFKIYNKLAGRGYPTAQCILGMKYRFGDGVKMDLQQAEKWLKKAAFQRHEAAVRNLADLYRSIGDLENANKWYHIGAINGDSYCISRDTRH